MIQKTMYFCIKFSNKHKLHCSNITCSLCILFETKYIQSDNTFQLSYIFTYVLLSQPICSYNHKLHLMIFITSYQNKNDHFQNHHFLYLIYILFYNCVIDPYDIILKHVQILKMTLSHNNSTCISIFNWFALI